MSQINVPVVGTFRYRDDNQTPAIGRCIYFSPINGALLDSGVVTLPRLLTAKLDSTGSIPSGFTLPTLPGGVYYRVTEEFDGSRGVYTIEVADDATEIDLATAAPVVPPEDLESTRGPQGPQGPQGAPGTNGADGADGADGASAYEVAVANGFVGDEAAWLASLVGAPGEDGAAGPQGEQGPPGEDAALPAGGTAGQALRKVNGTDGNAEWSPYWAIDQNTGKVTQAFSGYIAPKNGGGGFDGVAPSELTLEITQPVAYWYVPANPGMLTITADRSGNQAQVYQQTDYYPQGNVPIPQSTGVMNTRRVMTSNYIVPETTQAGMGCDQLGWDSAQIGGFNRQVGWSQTQSGTYNDQRGAGNTQSGAYNTQSGYYNRQSGALGFQHGGDYVGGMDDAGYDLTFMVGVNKVATAEHRAYFDLKNGVWLKPVTTTPASPENGVIYYNATTHKFRGYANGAWVDFH